MTKRVEYTILAAFVGLLVAVVKAVFPDAPLSNEGLMLLALYVLAKLGVEVIGRPAYRAAMKRFFPGHYVGFRTPPE